MLAGLPKVVAETCGFGMAQGLEKRESGAGSHLSIPRHDATA